MKRAAGWFVSLAAVALVSCASMQGREQLQQAVALHHIDLRWGRFANAARTVTPALQKAFIAEWTAKMQNVELQGIEVTGLELNPEGDGADVFVVITYVDRASMQVVNKPVQEHWTRTNTGWIADKPAEM